VPAKAAGKWSLPGGELTVAQEFQKITSGALLIDGKKASISGKLNGNKISFTAGDVEYTGEVQGDSMTLQSSSGKTWKGTRAVQ
jgi:hypothetical protein